MAVDQHEQLARLLLAQANYLESINQLRIAIAALETAAAAPLEDLLTVNDIYRPNLNPHVAPPAKPEPPQPAATPLVTPAATGTVQPAQEPPPATAAIAPPPPGDGTAYVIQLGAFKSKQRARVYQKSLKKRHPQLAFQTITANGMHKVRSTSFSSRAAAESALEVIGGEGLIVRAGTNR
jgi:cell division septation protein DedD